MLAALAGLAIPAIASFLGQREANNTNVAIADRTNAFNAEEALKNREFQAQQSSTAHQREVADLIKAGLNPALSATGGSGASSGSGSAASGVTATVGNELSGALSSAFQARQLMMAGEKQEADIALTKAQTAKSRTEEKVLQRGIPEAELKNDIYDTVRPYVKKVKEALNSSAVQTLRNDGWDGLRKMNQERELKKLEGLRDARKVRMP